MNSLERVFVKNSTAKASPPIVWTAWLSRRFCRQLTKAHHLRVFLARQTLSTLERGCARGQPSATCR